MMAKQEETWQSQELQDIGNHQAVHLEDSELPSMTPGVMICSTGCEIICDNLSKKDIIHIMDYNLLSYGQQRLAHKTIERTFAWELWRKNLK